VCVRVGYGVGQLQLETGRPVTQGVFLIVQHQTVETVEDDRVDQVIVSQAVLLLGMDAAVIDLTVVPVDEIKTVWTLHVYSKQVRLCYSNYLASPRAATPGLASPRAACGSVVRFHATVGYKSKNFVPIVQLESRGTH